MPFGAFVKGLANVALPFLSQGLNMWGNRQAAQSQEAANMRLAEYQYSRDREMMEYQMRYNSPEAQMGRFKDAGLNPNLIYGQGSPGNMESAPKFPSVQAGNYAAVTADLGTKLQQARLMSSQADLTDQKVQESGSKQDLMRAQTALAKANPYLNKGYVDAMVLQLSSAAKLKEQEKDFMTSYQANDTTAQSGGPSRWQRGFLKMQRELDALGQRFNLNNADQKVKAEILQSKEFQNQLQKIQVDWMKDGDITPEHIRTGIMLLLGKLK